MRVEGAQYGIEIIAMPRREVKGFVLDIRWRIAEGALAWLGKYRRLHKAYELILSSSLAMIYLEMIRLKLRRITLVCF